MKDLERILLKSEATIQEAWEAIGKGAVSIALLLDSDCCLVGTITDGDIRRAILDRVDLDAPATSLLKYHRGGCWDPIVAPIGTERDELLRLMREETIRHIPLLNEEGQVVDLVWISELLEQSKLPLSAVVMAGGHGMRLRPLTKDVPKPMLHVGDRPLLERIIEQLSQAGIRRISITTYYQGQQISDHFGDGQDFGVEMNYINEDRPLGTAGALGLMEVPQELMLVINGDILTQMNFPAMFAYHQEHRADLTVAVRKYDLEVPYGVIESDGAFVRELVEKPSFSFFVNAGIYLLEPSVHRYIPKGHHFDMTDLIQRLLEEQRPVASFPIVEYWIDIGQPGDYAQAQEDIENGRF